ncbi:MAG: sodium:dicarboxylate symporter [Ignavibacteria bacterium CG_4_8_14_3_um_filter_37_9]|nr:MAG: sodium:dicarboxylate symporter [Ignavibacteria bacterium CG08_land_8_20_14_0_20_37_9]PIW98392.1 MAG: sodium:dicarboxylate symporter [Ignavibacteria bacterium CG_4_8_14_3_um_filter_37_9]PIX95177.1 MAG: sodium:dicarboxylate symporter [Ignavibacteria bacterium CG_4_10_14_3_um_filter_37_18]
MKNKIGLFGGPLVFALFLFIFDFDKTNPMISKMAAVAALMAIWWVTEAIPLAATSLLPLFLFPILGILNGEQIANTYINSTIFLFLGGFLIALAMEKWNFHKRIALLIISIVGTSPEKIILGFLLASAFISMWISNTATAVMMLPIGLAIISQLEEKFPEEVTHSFSVAVLLSIAYGASIGGIATLIGTPPNLSMSRILHIIFPKAPELGFGAWMQLAFPVAIFLLTVCYFLLVKVFFKIHKDLSADIQMIKIERGRLGRVSSEEIFVGIVFSGTALLWIFRSDLVLGFVTIPGWSNIFSHPEYFNDGVVAIAMALLLFLIPSKNNAATFLLDKEIFGKIPWGIILLFGGGFALAKGFVATGLSESIGKSLTSFGSLSPVLIIVVIAVVVQALTELTSNTATTEMVLPITASMAVAMHVHPLFFMIPVTISASLAFMLPVATPPNAVIFGSQRLKISEMAKVGACINLVSIPVLLLAVYFLGRIIFNIDLSVFPDWAVPPVK